MAIMMILSILPLLPDISPAVAKTQPCSLLADSCLLVKYYLAIPCNRAAQTPMANNKHALPFSQVCWLARVALFHVCFILLEPEEWRGRVLSKRSEQKMCCPLV